MRNLRENLDVERSVEERLLRSELPDDVVEELGAAFLLDGSVDHVKEDRRLLGVRPPRVDNLDERHLVVQAEVEAEGAVISRLPRGILQRRRSLAVDHDVLVLVRVVRVDRGGHRPHVPLGPHHRKRPGDVPVVPRADHGDALAGQGLDGDLELDRDVDVAGLVGPPPPHALVVLDHLDRVLLGDLVRADHRLFEIRPERRVRRRRRLGGLQVRFQRRRLAGCLLELLERVAVARLQRLGLGLELGAKLVGLVHDAAQLLLHVQVLLH